MTLMNKLILVLVILLVVSQAAQAEDALPPIDMSQPLVDLRGKPIPDANDRTTQEAKDDPDCMKCPQLTLGSAVFNALLAMTSKHDARTGEFVLDAPQRQAYVALAVSLQDASQPSGYAKAVHLGTKPIERIKDAVGQFYPGTLVYRILPMVDPVGSSKAPELK